MALKHAGELSRRGVPTCRIFLQRPLEDRQVTISRTAAAITYPARFMLIAAMNPCPCGYFTDPAKECTCTAAQIQKYLAKISGPLLDRIDIHLEVPALQYQELTSSQEPEGSERIDNWLPYRSARSCMPMRPKCPLWARTSGDSGT